ncbi:MAG: hypothetical protein D6706_09340, partial [Chloroflexi bacterium]
VISVSLSGQSQHATRKVNAKPLLTAQVQATMNRCRQIVQMAIVALCLRQMVGLLAKLAMLQDAVCQFIAMPAATVNQRDVQGRIAVLYSP